MGRHSTSEVLIIRGSVDDCFRIITDFDRYPEWQAGMKSACVREKDSEDRGVLVDYDLDLGIKRVRYTLSYQYDRAPYCLTWELSKGQGVKAIDGSYTFRDEGDGTTRAEYSLSVDPGVWVPGPVIKGFKSMLMSRGLERFKARVEAAE